MDRSPIANPAEDAEQLGRKPADRESTRSGGQVNFVELAVSELVRGDSPRLGGEDEEHIRRLAEMQSEAPPILVHRETMQVIDGMHRLRAAILQNKPTIRAHFFEGDENEAFIRAVELNASHGLPLVTADRKAAASRILVANPESSDRSIAKITGLSDKTVAAIRRSAPNVGQSNTRRGEDGRAHPLDPSRGRSRAALVIAQRPDATLREIAHEAGISVSTAKHVRDRLRSSDQPTDIRPRPDGKAEPREQRMDEKIAIAKRGIDTVRGGKRPDGQQTADNLERLCKDPAVRFNEAGRELLRWLNGHSAGLAKWPDLMASVPPHCVETLAQLAAHYADEWQRVKRDLTQRRDLT